MITGCVISKGETYIANHLTYADYLDQLRQILGEWWGRGAEMLGLSGTVEGDQVERLRNGRHPETDEKLRQRVNLDAARSRTMYDFTFSAPKSVSIMAILGEDDRLFDAHASAVKEGLAQLQEHAETRVRGKGRNESRTTGNLVVAIYQHDTSRKCDPQIHSHTVAFNMTHDPVENRWKALEARHIYDNLNFLTEVYRNALARELRALGYEIEPAFDVSGKSLGFEIAGIGRDLREKFSQRSKDRDQAKAEFEAKKGRPATKRETAVLVRETREDKLIEIATDKLRAQQFARLTTDERAQIQAVRDRAARTQAEAKAAGRSLASEQLSTLQTLEAYVHAKDHLFERISVASEKQILTEAIIYGRGKVSLDVLQGLLAGEIEKGELIHSKDMYATRATLARENRIVENINRGSGRFGTLARADTLNTIQASPDQMRAILGVLDSRDRVVAIQGAAGTGKTSVLQTITQAIRDSGKEVLALAPTAAAVSVLQKDGFTNAATMERFLMNNWNAPAQDYERVILLDEAGMVGTQKMAEFLDLTESLNCRVVLVGDTRQLHSVDAGDAFRILQKDSRLETFKLTSIFRQSGKYRDAVKSLRDDPALGFNKLGKIGAIREMPESQVYAKAAKEVTDLLAKPNLKGEARSVLAVSPTWAGVGKLTSAIRTNLKGAKLLGREKSHKTLKDRHWTEAQKRDVRNYKAGDYLMFQRSTRVAKKGEVFKVREVKGDKIFATQGKKTVVFTKKQTKCFNVYERNRVQVAKGDRLLLQRNVNIKGRGLLGRSTAFRNGELVTVKSHDWRGRIVLDDGRVIPHDYQLFTHGWAVTAHASQGKTVDSVVVAGNRMTRETFYVAVSRGRESVAVFTSDKQGLAESASASSERLAALELAQERAREQSANQSRQASQSVGLGMRR